MCDKKTALTFTVILVPRRRFPCYLVFCHIIKPYDADFLRICLRSFVAYVASRTFRDGIVANLLFNGFFYPIKYIPT